MPLNYLLYSVAQYVHARREERLNVGVVIYDPASGKLTPAFRPKESSQRIRSLFPEVDRGGLEHYLHDVGRSIEKWKPDDIAGNAPNPLDALAAEWQNIIRFTPARPIPAVDAQTAVRQLLIEYVAEPLIDEERRQLRGVARAKRRTKEALVKVLRIPPGELGYGQFREFYSFWEHGKEYKLPIRFPFLVYSEHAIDAISFYSGGFETAEKEASAFIQKRKALYKIASNVQPYASVAIPPGRKEEGAALLAFMRDETGLADDAVVDADEAETMVLRIKARAA